MIKRITEVGVAVNSVENAAKTFTDLFTGERSGLHTSKNYPMIYEMVRLGNIDFELMEPLDQNSIIAKFLKKHGEGLHHIAFEVSDIDKSIDWLLQKGVRIINERPITVKNLKAIFLAPMSFGGVLIELIEGNPTWIEGRILPSQLKTQSKPQSIGVEGILEVGIIIRDLEATSAFYSNAFLCKNSEIFGFKHLSLRMQICRVGNVSLNLIEMENTNYLSDLTVNNTIGLHHITLKVRSIENAVTCLRQKGIAFIEDPLPASCDPKAIFIHPIALNGVLIRLTEGIHPY